MCICIGLWLFLPTLYSHKLWISIYFLELIGSGIAEVTINVPTIMRAGQPTSGNCIASGYKYSRLQLYCYLRIMVVEKHNEDHCNVTHIGGFQKLGEQRYQQNFNVTCNNSKSSIELKCFSCANEINRANMLGRSNKLIINLWLFIHMVLVYIVICMMYIL